MDKYEYKLKLDQMKSAFAEGNYHMAEELADSINWKRVRNANSLIKAGEVYETAERYDDAKEMFLLAYERSPIGRTIVYRLAELAIHVGNYDEAMEYYEEFVEMAPNDSLKFVLKYKIYKAKGESLAEQIQILEDLKEQEYIDIFTIVCYMKGIPLDSLHLFMKKDWRAIRDLPDGADNILIFMPEGVEAGEYIASPKLSLGKEQFYAGTKGEFPFLLTAISCLKENGFLAAVFPGAMLYREGREAQIRKYLVEELNCLDTIMLLPDSIFHSIGQAEAILFFQMNRERKDILFFDCSEIESLDKEQIDTIDQLWSERKTIPGLCACVERDEIEKNEYNLNLPRYITKVVKETAIDMEKGKARIREIEQELQEIENRIAIYRRELGL